MDDIESRADDAARAVLVGALDNPRGFNVTGFIEREWQAVPEGERERFLGNLASAMATKCVGALLAAAKLTMVDVDTGRRYRLDPVATLMEGATDDDA